MFSESFNPIVTYALNLFSLSQFTIFILVNLSIKLDNQQLTHSMIFRNSGQEKKRLEKIFTNLEKQKSKEIKVNQIRMIAN